jgi:hypothetical protein
MKRPTMNFIVDFVGLVNLMCLAFSGFIMKFILPPGTGGLGRGYRGGRGQGEEIKTLWSLSRHEWGDVHFYLAVLFLVLILVHIILHWNWIKCYTRSLFSLSQKKPRKEATDDCQTDKVEQ